MLSLKEEPSVLALEVPFTHRTLSIQDVQCAYSRHCCSLTKCSIFRNSVSNSLLAFSTKRRIKKNVRKTEIAKASWLLRRCRIAQTSGCSSSGCTPKGRTSSYLVGPGNTRGYEIDFDRVNQWRCDKPGSRATHTTQLANAEIQTQVSEIGGKLPHDFPSCRQSHHLSTGSEKDTTSPRVLQQTVGCRFPCSVLQGCESAVWPHRHGKSHRLSNDHRESKGGCLPPVN